MRRRISRASGESRLSSSATDILSCVLLRCRGTLLTVVGAQKIRGRRWARVWIEVDGDATSSCLQVDKPRACAGAKRLSSATLNFSICLSLQITAKKIPSTNTRTMPSAISSNARGLANGRKRKRNDASSRTKQPLSRKRAAVEPNAANDEDDDSISSGDSDAGPRGKGSAENSEDSDSDAADQTDAQRRLRLAERYLQNLQDNEDDADGDAGQDNVAARLQEDAAESQGRSHKRIAETLSWENAAGTPFRADTLATTGVAVCMPHVYTVSKDATLIKWKLALPLWSTEAASTSDPARPTPRRKKPKQVAFSKGKKSKVTQNNAQNHTDQILCVAASVDGKFVATGGQDKRLIIWDAKDLKPLRVFYQHRGAVCAVAFRGATNQLFSASKDRTVKIWSLDDMAYVETLFGHQDEVTDIAAVGGTHDRCVSVGSRDCSARLWKVAEETQLVFRGGAHTRAKDIPPQLSEHGSMEFVEGILDRVIQLDSQLFVTGSESGALSLFSLSKKKPLHIVHLAHGVENSRPANPQMDAANETETPIMLPRAITALACVPFSDLFISGSWDGCIRIWRISEDMRRIETQGCISNLEQNPGDAPQSVSPSTGKIPGIVNDLSIVQRGERGRDGVCIIAALGTELRHGRWMKKKGKNGAMVFEIRRSTSDAKT